MEGDSFRHPAFHRRLHPPPAREDRARPPPSAVSENPPWYRLPLRSAEIDASPAVPVVLSQLRPVIYSVLHSLLCRTSPNLCGRWTTSRHAWLNSPPPRTKPQRIILFGGMSAR